VEFSEYKAANPLTKLLIIITTSNKAIRYRIGILRNAAIMVCLLRQVRRDFARSLPPRSDKISGLRPKVAAGQPVYRRFAKLVEGRRGKKNEAMKFGMPW
jgi:hypothetical protein